MDETTKAQLTAIVRELVNLKLTAGGRVYPFSATLWDMRNALDHFDPEAAPAFAADLEAGRLPDAAREFVARADELLRIAFFTLPTDLRFGYEQLDSTLTALRQGPALIDRLAGLLVRHDEESPLLIEIGPLNRYAADFMQQVDLTANRLKAILSVSDGLS